MGMMRWIVVLFLGFPGIGLAETEPKFYLCSQFLEKSVIGEKTDFGWPVFVKLTEVGTTSLAAFTEANPGKMTRIVVGDRKFLRTTISTPITSGNLHGTFSSEEVATDWQRTLAGQLPTAPCGAGN
jgi:preprotein translocase subunit SecD